MERSIENLIASRNVLSMQQRELYITTIEKINIRNRELLKNDFGITLAKNIARDLAGEVCRKYFDLGDFYITVDQLVDRFLHFRYDNDQDFLMNNEEVRKAIYNAADGENSHAMQEVIKNCQGFQSQLFTEERSKDNFDINGKKNYRISRVENIHEENGKLVGVLRDELSGREVETTTKPQNKKDWYSRDLQADHRIPREAVTINGRYIKNSEEILNKYREFYNSEDNMQMMLASANSSKGDVRVCNVNGEIKYMNPKSKDYDPSTDITMFATADQLVEAEVHQWENASPKAKEAMKKGGYLDENGKVKQSVKDAQKEKFEKHLIARKEKLGDLGDFDYGNMAKDAREATLGSLGKIVSGQLIYYVMPPVLFETQCILRKKDMTLEKFFKEFKKAGKRIVNYVKSKLTDIYINIIGNSFNKFLKVFLDIIIEMAKTTVKKMLKIVKNVVLSLVNCCKTIVHPNMSVAQKADSVTKVMFTTINSIVLEIIFEYLEKQFALPDIWMEPLQIIVTVLSTNLIMLVLNKVDLFDVQYGLLTAKIDKLFKEENEQFVEESFKMLEEGYEISDETLKLIERDIIEIVDSIQELDLRKDDVIEPLENLNKLFSMGIDFEDEWRNFIRKGDLVTL